MFNPKIQLSVQDRLRKYAPQFSCIAIFAIFLAFVFQAYSFTRVLQITILFTPGALMLMMPIKGSLNHRIRTIAIAIWIAIFVTDAVIRAFILNAYQATPNSTFVLGSLANTNFRESMEYAQTLASAFSLQLIPGTALLLLAFWLASFGRRRGTLAPTMRAVLVVILTLSSIAYIVKPWRKLHPIVFWTGFSQLIADTKAHWRQYDRTRADAKDRAGALGARIKDDRPSTVVLVISDSVNRDNMSLYGYGRPTTPALSELRHRLGDQMIVFNSAWSVEASTLPSMHRMFELDNGNHVGEDPHILAVARSAGYRTWWISNHDDIGIEQEHAKLAREVVLANRSPGRSGGGLDENLLPHLRSAIDDPAPRKFIVVHLMGAHPHYQLRYPAHAEAFTRDDAIDQDLQAAGRSWGIGKLRKSYDSAIRYNDAVVAQTLDMLREIRPAREDEHRAWMYLSDHGQEVGHTSDFAGHSRTTSSGYRIPAVVWRNQPWPGAGAIAANRFRADWTSWVLADLLRLEWHGKEMRYSALSGDYRWIAPITPGNVVAGDQINPLR